MFLDLAMIRNNNFMVKSEHGSYEQTRKNSYIIIDIQEKTSIVPLIPII